MGRGQAEGKRASRTCTREPFTFPAWIRGAESAEIVAPVPQHLAITALGGSVATDASGIEAEIALFRTYAELLAAPPGSLAGKIAVVTQRMVRAQDGSGYGAANPIRRSGPSEAAKRGAVAYLLRSLGTDSHRLPHTGALNYDNGAPRIPAAALANPDADQLERLAALGPVRVRLVLTPTVHENAPSWNVVGEVKGAERPEEIVLIGGHLDSWDLGTGATDDGAGIAIAFGAARLIAGLPQRPSRTIRVVLFGAEEMDFSGAAYAKAHEERSGKIVVAGEADFGARIGLFRAAPARRRRQRFRPHAGPDHRAARRQSSIAGRRSAAARISANCRRPACRWHRCARTGSIISTSTTPPTTRSTRSTLSSSSRRSRCGRLLPISPRRRTRISEVLQRRRNKPRGGHA